MKILQIEEVILFMYETLNYIFDSINSSENAVKVIKHTLKKQRYINRSLSNMCFIMAIYIGFNECNQYEQNRKIKALNQEVKELKQTKGE